MASTYSPDLRLELIGNGQQTGIWGTTTNVNLGTLLEQAIAGAITINVGAPTVVQTNKQALTAYSGVTDQARYASVAFTTSLTQNFEVYVPPVTKMYAIQNLSNTYTATIYAWINASLPTLTNAGVGIAVPPGASVLLRCDGTNIVEQLDTVVGDFDIGGTQTNSGNQISLGSYTLGGSAFLGGDVAVTIGPGSPALFTVALAPLNDTKVMFYTGGDALPTEISNTAIFTVYERSATTFRIKNSAGTPVIVGSVPGTGYRVTAVSTTYTAPTGTNSNQLATTAFVAAATGAISNTISLTNWAITETFATQAISSLTLDSPAVITVPTAPANGTAVAFTAGSGGVLPTGITVNIPYFVFGRTSNTYKLSTTQGTAQNATLSAGVTGKGFISNGTSGAAGTILTVTEAPSSGSFAIGQVLTGTGVTANTAIVSPAGTGGGGLGTYNVNISQATGTSAAPVTLTGVATPGVVTVTTAPNNGDVVVFSTTGALPTGITAGTQYYVVNRTSTTFNVSATSGGTAINFSGSQSGSQVVTVFSLINTSGTVTLPLTETTSKIYFKYKNLNRMSLDLAGNSIVTGNVTAFGTP